jgi:COPI associated protein
MIVQIIAAIALIVLSIVRIIKIVEAKTFTLYVMMAYFVMFGLIILSVELGLKFMKRTFYFLNFAWGKAIFDFFIACMSLSMGLYGTASAIQIPIAILFFIATIGLIGIALCYRREEKERE